MKTKLIFCLVCLFLIASCSPETETEANSSTSPQEAPISEASKEPEQTPIPYDKAKVKTFYKEIVSINQSFDAAFKENNSKLFIQTKEEAKQLVQELEKIELIFHPLHPASACKSAAVNMESARTQAWATLNNSDATDTDKNIDEKNMKDFQDALDMCRKSAGE